MKRIVLVALCVGLVASLAQAAFIVEPHGKASANFAVVNGGGAASIPSTAIGCTGTGSTSHFGGNNDGTLGNTYIVSYTPGVNADNATIAAGTDLGNGDLASGLAGGGSGLYNVYMTVPASTNVNVIGSTFTTSNDGAAVVIGPLNLNTGGTGTPGATNAWLLIAANVPLTAGNTYTVTQYVAADNYVSQRLGGIMWEAVPEPAAVVLLSLGSLVMICRRRAA
ncbi:MAG: PEP-CTERM sorting domain-containing protein [Phycisphaerae bacterium]|jgi:hypothetical protein|nr:PEP-CTERM sorting domain-containing protein [Phycisphaerae bacterium]